MTEIASFRDAAAGYPGRVVWRELDFGVEAGEYIAVLGGNGTGKTTLLKMLLGLLPPVSGQVRVLGEPPRRGDRRIGYVPQHREFDRDMPARGVDLVTLGARGHRYGFARLSATTASRVAAAIDTVGATSYASAPVGLLSGGEQQRLRIASAIVDLPRLVLADEPLSSLDPAGQRQVASLFDEQRRETGAAVIVVTHDINPLLPYVDRVLYFAGGRWAAGPPEQVLTSDSLSELYGVDIEVVRVRDHLVIVGAPDAPTAAHHEHGGAA